MFNKFLPGIFLAFWLSVVGMANAIDAAPLNLNQISEASCRIHTGGSHYSQRKQYGSGTCIHEDNKYYYVLTNAHVVGNQNTVNLEFFKMGQKTRILPGRVIWRKFKESTTQDFAIVIIAKSHFAHTFKPRVAKLISPDYTIKNNDYIYSAGCPQAKWLVSWEGHAIIDGQTRVLFVPPPEGGQSGSGVFIIIKKGDEYYTRLAAVITWRISDQKHLHGLDENGYPRAKGGAIPIQALYRLLTSRQSIIPQKVPTHWKPVANYTHQAWVLGSDNSYYLAKWDANKQKWACWPPFGIHILRWPSCPTCPPRQPRQPRQPRPPRPLVPVPPSNTQPTPAPTPGQPIPGQPAPTPSIPLPSDLWGDDDEKNVKKLQTEINTLKNQIKRLDIRISQLTDANGSLDAEKNSLKQSINKKLDELTNKENKLQNLQQKYDSLHAEISSIKGGFEAQLDEKEARNDKINLLLDNNQTKLDNLNIQLETLGQQQETLQQEKVSWTSIKDRITKERNVLGSTAITSIIALVGYWWWVRRGGQQRVRQHGDNIQEKVNEYTDTAQQRIDKRLRKMLEPETVDGLKERFDDLQDEVNQKVDGLQESVEQTIKEQFEANLPPLIKKYVISEPIPVNPTVNPTVNPKLVDMAMSEPPVKSVKPVESVEPIEPVIEQREQVKTAPQPTVPQPPPTSPTDFSPDDNLNKKHVNNSSRWRYIHGFFKNKVKDGEKIEDWALLGILYKEAIVLLREGRLYVSTNNPLQGQQKTAQKITDWVREQFLRRMSANDLQQFDNLYYEAILGFLYKEAVNELKNGRIQALGGMQTAETIEQWVQKALLKRLNVNLESS